MPPSTTALPTITIQVVGVLIEARFMRGLIGVQVTQVINLPAQCELTFSDPPGALPTPTPLLPGIEIRVLIDGSDVPLFVGQVTAVEHVYTAAREKHLRVRAYDPLHRLRKRQTVRAFSDVSLSDLASQFAGDAGLSVQSEADSPTWHSLIQTEQSDYEFLIALAERCGLYLTVRDGTLHLITLVGTGEALPLKLGESLMEARVEVNGHDSARQITAEGWNAGNLERFDGQIGSARSGRSIEAQVLPADVGANEDFILVNEAAGDASQIAQLAQAELDRRIANEVTLWGVASGDPALQPGAIVDASGLDHEVSGRYVLTECRHTVDTEMGYVTEFSTRVAEPPRRPRAAVLAPATVSAIEDPDSQARVRVRLITYQNVETDWMPVLLHASGANKGLIALPDLDDQVMVLFAGEDPAQGIVLGGVYGGWGSRITPPDTGIESGQRQRFTFLTPGGQRIRMDDSGGLVRVENNDGSYLEMTPTAVKLHSQQDMTVEAPGKKLVITASMVDFVQG
ncbi:MAG: phage baseplate assembly protein V [Anaerolineae bacterium]